MTVDGSEGGRAAASGKRSPTTDGGASITRGGERPSAGGADATASGAAAAPAAGAGVAATVRVTPAGLWNRDFVLLWQGQLVSGLGSQASFVAMMLWTLEATGSPALMGLLLMSSALPGVLLGPVAGTIVDRWSRKRIIVLGDAARGVAAVAVAAALALTASSSEVVLSVLVAAVVFSGVIGAVFNPAVYAAVPELVPQDRLAAANSLNQASGQGSVLAGQALGGVLYRALGPAGLFLVDGISFLLSAGSESFIRLPRVASPARHGVREALAEYWTETAAGIRHALSEPGRRGFIALAAGLNFLFMPIFVLLPLFVDGVLLADPEWYGFLLAGISGGSLLGMAVSGTVGDREGARGAVLMTALAGTTVLMIVLSVVREPWVALLVTAGLGALTGLINILVITLFQLRTPPDMRGRMMAVLMALTSAATPIGMGAGGLIGEAAQGRIPLVYAGCGIAALLLVAAIAPRAAVRRFLAGDDG